MTRTIVHFLIPLTSKNRAWGDINDSNLNTILLPSLKSYNHLYEIEPVFHFGIDLDEPIYTESNISNILNGFKYDVVIFDSSVRKGHLTAMWNIIFKKVITTYPSAWYFFQCGDDIMFMGDECFSSLISVIDGQSGIGIACHLGENPNIFTQALFTRKHFDIFGWLFPEEIINWHCDDWYNEIYEAVGKRRYIKNGKNSVLNKGGCERYTIVDGRNTLNGILNRDINKINKYILNSE